MVINPYGLHGAPAVGAGLPGLPRRKDNAAQTSSRSTLDDYDVILVYTDSSDEKVIRRVSTLGEVKVTLPTGTDLPALYTSMSEDGKYLLTVHRSNSGGEKYFVLTDVNKMEVLASRNYGNTNNFRGVEAHILSEKGWILFINDSLSVRIITVDDFINAPQGPVLNLPALDDGFLTASKIAVHPSGDVIFYARSISSISSQVGAYSLTERRVVQSRTVGDVNVGNFHKLIVDPKGNSFVVNYGSYVVAYDPIYAGGEVVGISEGETIITSGAVATPLALYKEEEYSDRFCAHLSSGDQILFSGGGPTTSGLNLTGTTSSRGNNFSISTNGLVFASNDKHVVNVLVRQPGGLALDNNYPADIRAFSAGSNRSNKPSLHIVSAR